MRICMECDSQTEVKGTPAGLDICPDCRTVEGRTMDMYDCPQCHELLSGAFYTDAQPECVRCVMKACQPPPNCVQDHGNAPFCTCEEEE